MRDFDLDLDEVLRYINSVPYFQNRMCLAVRQAFDDVLDFPRTKRTFTKQLTKVEKTYIGTRVEIIVKDIFKFADGEKLDCKICEKEVDIKFSLKENGWMIPREAVGEICLLISADETEGVLKCGLVRATTDILSVGSNQDGKKSISKLGRSSINWIFEPSRFPDNFADAMNAEEYEVLVSPSSSPLKRISILSNAAKGRLIPGSVVTSFSTETISAKDYLRKSEFTEIFEILDGDSEEDRILAQRKNLELTEGFFLILKKGAHYSLDSSEAGRRSAAKRAAARSKVGQK